MKEKENSLQVHTEIYLQAKKEKIYNYGVHPAEHLEFWFSLLRFGTHRNQINGDHAKEIWLQRLKIIYLATTSQKLKRDSEFLEPFSYQVPFQYILGSKTQNVILVLEAEIVLYICQVFNKYLLVN